MNISQSLMKDFEQYTKGQYCGLQFQARYFDGVEFPASEAMEIGVWFEYLCTGQTPRSGKIPVPEVASKGASKGEPKAKWKVAEEQANRFKMALEHYKFVVKESGTKLITDDQEEGTLDVIAVDMRQTIEDDRGKMVENPDYQKEIIIDIKNSGLLENKWEPMGWELESLPEKRLLMIQPVMYKFLFFKKFGYYPTFYFFVHSNTNDIESKIIKVNVDPDAFPRHQEQINDIRAAVEMEATVGFRAYPEVKRCFECPLHSKCSEAITVPKINEIFIS